MLTAMHTTVIRALVAKRREILSELNHHRLAEIRLGHALEHIEPTIRLFADDLTRTLLGALRVAGRPVSVEALAADVRVDAKRVGRALRQMADCGLVRAERALWVATL